jgi:CheY-like chemotaxis protein
MEGLLGEQVRLVLDLEPNPWPITLDPNELEQALLNLAANARDAMPTGGSLTLRLKNQVATEPQITPFLPIPAGEMVVLEVADTGTGMSEATLQHLFEPFFTTKGRGKGTGLGLASVYGFVKASLGGIAVDTQLGRGTTIRLAFPRSSRPIEAESLPSDTAPLLGKETVLLVEDDPSIRETTQRILAANGYTVLDAGNADEARIVFQFHNKEIQILITDVIMPGDSGPVLAAELVATQPGLRVLYISGYTADELGPHGLARPDAPLLRKPFTVGQLTRRLRSIMAGPPGRY